MNRPLPSTLAAASMVMLVMLVMPVMPGCGPGREALGLAADDDEGDGTDNEGQGTEDPTSGNGCTSDDECPSGYECWDGECSPICTHPGTTGIAGINAGTPVYPVCSDWGEDNNEWGDGDGDGDPGCVSSEDCGAGRACLQAGCVTAEPISACPGPSFVARSLGLVDDVPVHDLAFVDFDGDQQDELVLLLDELLLVVDGQATSSITVPSQLDVMAVGRFDEDGVPDLFLGSHGADAATLVVGSPDQLPAIIEPLLLVDVVLGDALGVDWLAGGTDELVLTAEPPTIAPLLVEGLATGAPTQTPLDRVSGSRVGILELGGDQLPELWFAHECRVQVLAGARAGLVFDDDLQTSGCEFAAGSLVDGADELVALVPGNGIDLIVELALDRPLASRSIAGSHAQATVVSVADWPREAVLLSRPDATLVWSSGGQAPDCHASVPELATTVRAVSGDVDGDGIAELATIDELGAAHLWTSGG